MSIPTLLPPMDTSAAGTWAPWIDGFIYTLTHDLRASTRALNTLPDWIAEDLAAAEIDVPKAVQEHIAMMRDASSALDTLLDRLAELRHAGLPPIWSASVDLAAVLQSAAGRTQQEVPITFDFSAAAHIGEAPPTAIEAACAEIIANASAHHHRSSGHVIGRAHREGPRLRIRLEDDGPGIAPTQWEAVFRPMQGPVDRRPRLGAGLGLTIARRHIEAAGGRLDLAEPQHLTGTALVIDLPVSAPLPVSR